MYVGSSTVLLPGNGTVNMVQHVRLVEHLYSVRVKKLFSSSKIEVVSLQYEACCTNKHTHKYPRGIRQKKQTFLEPGRQRMKGRRLPIMGNNKSNVTEGPRESHCTQCTLDTARPRQMLHVWAIITRLPFLYSPVDMTRLRYATY